MEMVQGMARRMIEECGDMDYEQRLKYTRLTTLETRRERADMLEVYKTLSGLEGRKEIDFFIRDKGRERGHDFKLYKKRVRLDIAGIVSEIECALHGIICHMLSLLLPV